MDFCTHGHMIDNVVLIVTGTLHERDVQELLDKCHPLGMFDSIATLAVAQNMRELFRCVALRKKLHEGEGRAGARSSMVAQHVRRGQHAAQLRQWTGGRSRSTAYSCVHLLENPASNVVLSLPLPVTTGQLDT